MVDKTGRNGAPTIDWRKVQVSLEMAVEFVEFFNIDLLDHGVYQIRSTLKCDGRIPHCIEVASVGAVGKKSVSGGFTDSPSTSSLQNGEGGPGLFASAAFETQPPPNTPPVAGELFRIRHDNQRVRLNQLLLYRVFLLLDPTQIEEGIDRTEFSLCLDIVHVERDGTETSRQSVGERTIKFYVSQAGLHFHRPVLFGYTYFCQLSLTVHATLIALQEPYRRFQYEVKPISWKRDTAPRVMDVVSNSSMSVIVFGSSSLDSPDLAPNPDKSREVQQGRQRMVHMCRILITALEALQASYLHLQNLADPVYILSGGSIMDCQLQLALCTSELETALDRETLIETGQKLVTQMAGEIVRLWTNYLDAFVGCSGVHEVLMEGFRRRQLQRLGEAVFLLDHHKSALMSKSQSGAGLARHDAVWEMMRRSKYYTGLVALPLACVETDGRAQDVPVIFEDRYYGTEEGETASEANGSEGKSGAVKNGSSPSSPATARPVASPSSSVRLSGIVAADEEPQATLKSVRRIRDPPTKPLSPLTGRSASRDESTSSPVSCSDTPRHEQWLTEKCLLSEMLKEDLPPLTIADPALPDLFGIGPEIETSLVPTETAEQVAFVEAKADFRQRCRSMYSGLLFSDYPLRTASHSCAQLGCDVGNQKVHLVICVHGLEGTHEDMKLVRTYLERALPQHRLQFLMSESVNGNTTYRAMEHLTETLVTEIVEHLSAMQTLPEKISFVGHSLGALLVRAAIAHPHMEPYLPSLWTFLSFCGPHFGLINNSSKIVQTGLWLFLKWRKAESLTQLALRDHPDPRQTFVYRLSQRDACRHFRHLLLVASAQDHYAPYFSARMEPISRTAVWNRGASPEPTTSSLAKDTSAVAIQNEMALNVLRPLTEPGAGCKVVRYDVRVPTEGAGMPDNITGRLTHIAVIDSEIFLEKFVTINLQYFA